MNFGEMERKVYTNFIEVLFLEVFQLSELEGPFFRGESSAVVFHVLGYAEYVLVFMPSDF